MARELYNEGRVQGMSAYEIYVRQHMNSGNPCEPASEREWLVASIASGASLMYRFDKSNNSDEGRMSRTIKLPENSTLGCANPINAYFFDDSNFDVVTENNGWVTKLTYKETAEKADVQDIELKYKIRDYLRIVDGNINQLDINSNPTMTISIAGNITAPFYVLFTGFTSRAVLSGTSNEESENASNGDFLGPAVIPKYSKILFLTPTEYISKLVNKTFVRNINGHLTTSDSESIVDIESCDLYEYYKSKERYSQKITDIDTINPTNKASVLAIYQKNSNFAPALWAASLYGDKEDDQYIFPVDVVAPGTLKVFTPNEGTSEANLKEMMESYEDEFPLNKALGLYDNGRSLGWLDENGELVKQQSIIIDNPHIRYTEGKKETDSEHRMIRIKDNSSTYLALSLSDDSGAQCNISKRNKSNEYRDINWYDLIEALHSNTLLDVLGPTLKSISDSIKKGYIEFGKNKTRLYISSSEPIADSENIIPDGSIGIGW